MGLVKRLGPILLAALLAAGCAAAMMKGAGSGPSSPTSDGSITLTIEQRMAAEPSLGAVEVATSNGIVTLDGRVPDEAARRRAEQLARTAKGVRAVRNQIAVR